MPIVLVAYEIHPHEDTEKAKKLAADRRGEIEGFIEQHQAHKLSESAYALDVPEPVMVFANEVLGLTREGDELYVIPLAALPPPSPSFFARAPEASETWLRLRLRPPA